MPNFTITYRREPYLWRWCVCIDWGHKLYFLELECLFCSMGNEWCLTTFKQGIVFLCFSMQRLVVLWTDSSNKARQISKASWCTWEGYSSERDRSFSFSDGWIFGFPEVKMIYFCISSKFRWRTFLRNTDKY